MARAVQFRPIRRPRRPVRRRCRDPGCRRRRGGRRGPRRRHQPGRGSDPQRARCAQVFPATFPSGEGSDLAGIVSAVGPGSTEFAVGDEVLGWSWRRSSHAEYVAVPVTQLIAKPAGLSWEVAGSLYVVGCTAYAAVRAVGAGAGRHRRGVGGGRRGGQRRRPAPADQGREGHRHRLGGQPRLARRRRGPSPSPTATGSPTACGGGPGRDRRVHRPVRARVRAAGVDLGIEPARIETIIAREKAQELGAKSEGSGDATRRVLAEMAELVASGQIEIPIAATYPLEQVRDAFARARRATHPRKDRPAPLTAAGVQRSRLQRVARNDCVFPLSIMRPLALAETLGGAHDGRERRRAILRRTRTTTPMSPSRTALTTRALTSRPSKRSCSLPVTRGMPRGATSLRRPAPVRAIRLRPSSRLNGTSSWRAKPGSPTLRTSEG